MPLNSANCKSHWKARTLFNETSPDTPSIRYTAITRVRGSIIVTSCRFSPAGDTEVINSLPAPGCHVDIGSACAEEPEGRKPKATTVKIALSKAPPTAAVRRGLTAEGVRKTGALTSVSYTHLTLPTNREV